MTATLAIAPPDATPVPSGVPFARDCGFADCSGLRVWLFPIGVEVEGHCCCAVGRRMAEQHYAQQHGDREVPR